MYDNCHENFREVQEIVIVFFHAVLAGGHKSNSSVFSTHCRFISQLPNTAPDPKTTSKERDKQE